MTGQSTDFTGSGTAAGGVIPGNQLGWTPTDTALGDAVTLGPTVMPAGPGLGTVPGLLASAPEGMDSGPARSGRT